MVHRSDPKSDAPGAPDSDDALDSLAARFHAGESANGGGARAQGAELEDAGASGGHSGAAGREPAASRGATILDDEPSADDLRSTALGKRLAQRRGYAIAAREPKTRRLLSSWGLGGVLLLSLWSLWGTWPEARYWLSREAPADLGHLGGYRLEDARDGAFTRVEGIASPKRATYSRMFGEHELFPLIASRILIDRAGSPDESLRGYGFHYSGEGRLVRVGEGSKWEAVREQFVSQGELARGGDVWVLEDGVSPHRGMIIPLQVGGWLLLALACAGAILIRARRAVAAKT